MAMTPEQLATWKEICAIEAAQYANEALDQPPYSKYGNEPNIRKILAWSIAHSEENRLVNVGMLVTTLTFAGFVNPASGDPTGASENMGDADMQRMADGSPGFQWFTGTDKNGVAFRVAIPSEPLIAQHPRSWYWRGSCVFEVEGNRYAYATQSILRLMQDGIPNPSGK